MSRSSASRGPHAAPAPFKARIRSIAGLNRDFRRVLFTGRHLQLVVMSVPPRGEIGLERHAGIDQLIRVERGRARVYVGESRPSLFASLRAGELAVIPAGTYHRVVNPSARAPLQISTIYSPPEHPPGTRQRRSPQ